MTLLLAACGGDDNSGNAVASLEDETTTTAVDEADRISNNEVAVLALTQCLRENGLDDIADPRMDENGNVDLQSFFDIASSVDPDAAEIALEACSDLLDDVQLGFDQADLTELQDTLIVFAECMRDNGYDLPDPDFSIAALQGDGPFGPIDLEDPEFEAALPECDTILAGITVTGD